MSQGAEPPDPPFAGGCDLGRQQGPVFCRVPFLGQPGKLTGQIIDAWSHSTVDAHRTAAAICAEVDRCTPHMAMAAPPPYLFLTSRQYTLRSQRQILGGVSVSCQFREPAGQVGFSGPRSSAGAVGAIGVAVGAVVHRCLPAVAICTLPPHLVRTSVGNGFRGKGKIGLTIPLGKQFCTAFRLAEGR